MIPCRIVDALTAVIPWRFARDSIRLHHAERCAVYRRRLLSRDEAGSLIGDEKEAGDGKGFWSGVRTRIRDYEKAGPTLAPPRLSRASKWAALTGAAALAAAAFLIIWGGAPQTPLSGAGEPMRFELGSLKVNGESVTPVVIQPEGSDVVIVWAGIDR